MNATAQFISDRAQTLAYEALQFPTTAKVAVTWLDLAIDAALKIGSLELAFELECIRDRICDHYIALEMLEERAA